MSDLEKRPNRMPWPPLIYISAIALAIVLNWLYPLPWIGQPLSDILFAVGALAIVAVVAIDFSAMRTLRKHNTTIMPNKGADHLVTDGPYSFTRNPIYLSNSLIMIGAGLLLGMLWLILLSVVAGFVTQKLAIEPEEKHLALRFGKKYRDYAKRVRRWI